MTPRAAVPRAYAGCAGRGRSTKVVLAALVAGCLGATTLRAQTHLLIVSGLGGEAKYSEAFRRLSLTLVDAATKRFGIPDSDVVYLAEDTSRGRGRIRGASTRDNIDRTLTAFARRSLPADQLVIVLIGHGSGEGPDSRISLPGPDPTAADFARMLARFPTQRIAFIDLTSASGDVLPFISATNRVVITATKSSFERNETVFAQYFVQAYTADVADVDKDGRVSLLEAFRFAAAETKRHYDSESRLQTEHAQLDDDGDKSGSTDPDPRTGDGALAARFFLDAGTYAARGATDGQLAALYKEKLALEDQIDALKKRKSTMVVDAYEAELERLLVALAVKARDIRRLEGRTS
jgi:hypothetical protein